MRPSYRNRIFWNVLDQPIRQSSGHISAVAGQEAGGEATVDTLKGQFKGVFQNISSVMDCISCQKCKLHGAPTSPYNGIKSYRGEYFDKMLGGSVYSTNYYQTMTNMIFQ